MCANSVPAKFLRFIGIVLMGITSGFTLLGGIGTSCVALAPKGFGASMAKLVPYQWLYILFVLIGVAIGILGIRATIMLVKGNKNSYHNTLYVLIAGIAIGIIHILTSRALRGNSMPVDAVVYTTILTLIFFLILRIPPLWQGVDFSKSKPNSNRPAGGIAAILVGVLALSIQHIMASTHTWNGVNYANAFNISMTLIGLVCLLIGAGLVIKGNGREAHPACEHESSVF